MDLPSIDQIEKDLSRSPKLHDMTVLSIDCLGSRIFAALEYLRELREEIINQEREFADHHEEPRPDSENIQLYDYFDLAIGTGTAGAALMMLVHLKLSLNTIIKVMKQLQDVFVPWGFSRIHRLGRYSGKKLRRWAEDVVQQSLSQRGKETTPELHRLIYDGSSLEPCQAAITTTRVTSTKFGTSGGLRVLRTYEVNPVRNEKWLPKDVHVPADLTDAPRTIDALCTAISDRPSFKGVKIGDFVYFNAGTIGNNSAGTALDEATCLYNLKALARGRPPRADNKRVGLVYNICFSADTPLPIPTGSKLRHAVCRAKGLRTKLSDSSEVASNVRSLLSTWDAEYLQMDIPELNGDQISYNDYTGEAFRSFTRGAANYLNWKGRDRLRWLARVLVARRRLRRTTPPAQIPSPLPDELEAPVALPVTDGNPVSPPSTGGAYHQLDAPL